MPKYRTHLEEAGYVGIVPESHVLKDTDNEFVYLARDGVSVVGWHENTETFWRNRNVDTPVDDLIPDNLKPDWMK